VVGGQECVTGPGKNLTWCERAGSQEAPDNLFVRINDDYAVLVAIGDHQVPRQG